MPGLGPALREGGLCRWVRGGCHGWESWEQHRARLCRAGGSWGATDGPGTFVRKLVGLLAVCGEGPGLRGVASFSKLIQRLGQVRAGSLCCDGSG